MTIIKSQCKAESYTWPLNREPPAGLKKVFLTYIYIRFPQELRLRVWKCRETLKISVHGGSHHPSQRASPSVVAEETYFLKWQYSSFTEGHVCIQCLGQMWWQRKPAAEVLADSVSPTLPRVQHSGNSCDRYCPALINRDHELFGFLLVLSLS